MEQAGGARCGLRRQFHGGGLAVSPVVLRPEFSRAHHPRRRRPYTRRTVGGAAVGFDIRRLVPLPIPPRRPGGRPSCARRSRRSQPSPKAAPSSDSSRHSPRTAPQTSWSPTARPIWTARSGFASVCRSFPTTPKAGCRGARSGAGRLSTRGSSSIGLDSPRRCTGPVASSFARRVGVGGAGYADARRSVLRARPAESASRAPSMDRSHSALTRAPRPSPIGPAAASSESTGPTNPA